MKMSCNGCRILRKGCSQDCPIRPSLQWIKSPHSQANATLFLAKFYGRAGLINLLAAGQDHLRPDIFRSLLYDACGRIINPVYGPVGLLWSGRWQLCQTAVEAVLKGAPITPIPSKPAATATPSSPPSQVCDIRHVPREVSAASRELLKVRRRSRFKRSVAKPKLDEPDLAAANSQSWLRCYASCSDRASSRESMSSQKPESSRGSSEDGEGMFSTQTEVREADEGEVQLELTLGSETRHLAHTRVSLSAPLKAGFQMDGRDGDACKMEMGLNLIV